MHTLRGLQWNTIVLNIWRCHESAWSCDVTVILLRTKCRWRKTVTNCLQPNHLHCRGVKYRHRVRCCVSEIRWCLACSSSKDCTRRMEIEGGFCLFFVFIHSSKRSRIVVKLLDSLLWTCTLTRSKAFTSIIQSTFGPSPTAVSSGQWPQVWVCWQTAELVCGWRADLLVLWGEQRKLR